MLSKNGIGKSLKKEMKCKCGKQFKIRYQNGIRVSKLCEACVRKKERLKKKQTKEREKVRRVKKKEKKLNSPTYRTKQLDTIWSKKVKELAGGRCVICGETNYLNAHHYIGRQNKATRWYIPNGIAVCPKHHTFDVKSAHGNPEWFREVMLNARGKEWLDDIVLQSNKTFLKDFDKVDSYLKEELKNYL
jgi:hypothetical protein